MNVVVLGTGYLGSALVACLKDQKVPVIHTYNTKKRFSDSTQFDIFSHSISELVDLGQIDAIVFTLSIEHLPSISDVVRAMKDTIAQCKGKRVVYISSDAVFSGNRGMYSEDDVPDPAITYGKCKLACEEVIKEKTSNYCIIRPSYLYGYTLGKLDKRLEEAKRMVRKGQPITKFIDMFKSPTEVNYLAKVITYFTQSYFTGTLHVGGSRISVYDFFSQALSALGEKPQMVKGHIPKNNSLETLSDTSLDSSKLLKEFNFNPPVLLESLQQVTQ